MITNLASLRAALKLWLDRDDLSAMVDEFIALAESDIRRKAKTVDMLVRQTGTLVDGRIAMPERLFEIRKVKVNGKEVDMPDFKIHSDGIDIVGATSEPYELEYWRYYSSMVDDADTNKLLQDAPDLYLFSARAYARDFLHDDLGYQKEMGQFLARIAEVNARSEASMIAGTMMRRPGK